jgi:hypothetical protein
MSSATECSMSWKFPNRTAAFGCNDVSSAIKEDNIIAFSIMFEEKARSGAHDNRKLVLNRL